MGAAASTGTERPQSLRWLFGNEHSPPGAQGVGAGGWRAQACAPAVCLLGHVPARHVSHSSRAWGGKAGVASLCCLSSLLPGVGFSGWGGDAGTSRQESALLMVRQNVYPQGTGGMLGLPDSFHRNPGGPERTAHS